MFLAYLLLIANLGFVQPKTLTAESACVANCLINCIESGQHYSSCACPNNENECSINSTKDSLPLTSEAFYQNAHTIAIAITSAQHPDAYGYILEYKTNNSWIYSQINSKPQFQFSTPDLCASYQFRICLVRRNPDGTGTLLELGKLTTTGSPPDFVIESANVALRNISYYNESDTVVAYYFWSHPYGYKAEDVARYNTYLHAVQCNIPDGIYFHNSPIPEVHSDGVYLRIDFPGIMLEKKCNFVLNLDALSVCNKRSASTQLYVTLNCVKIPIANYPCKKPEIAPKCLRDVKISQVVRSDDKNMVLATVQWMEPRFGAPLYYHIRLGKPTFEHSFGPITIWRLRGQTQDQKVDGTQTALELTLPFAGFPFGVQVCAIYSNERKSPKFGSAAVYAFTCSCTDDCRCAKAEKSHSGPAGPPSLPLTPFSAPQQTPTCTDAIEIAEVKGSQKDENISVTVSWKQPRQGIPVMYIVKHGTPQKDITIDTKSVWSIPRKSANKIRLNPSNTQYTFELENDQFPYGVLVCAVYGFNRKKPVLPSVFAFECHCDDIDCSCYTAGAKKIKTEKPVVLLKNFTQTVQNTDGKEFKLMFDWSLPDDVEPDDVMAHDVTLISEQPCDGKMAACCMVADATAQSTTDTQVVLNLPKLLFPAGCQFALEIKTKLANNRTSVVSRVALDTMLLHESLINSACAGINCQFGCDMENNRCQCPEQHELVGNTCIYVDLSPGGNETVPPQQTTTTSLPTYLCLSDQPTMMWLSTTELNVSWQDFPMHFDTMLLRWGPIEAASDTFYRIIEETNATVKTDEISWYIIQDINSTIYNGIQLCVFDSERIQLDQFSTYGHRSIIFPVSEFREILQTSKPLTGMDPMLKLALMIVVPISGIIMILSICALVFYFKWETISSMCAKCKTKSYKPHLEQIHFEQANGPSNQQIRRSDSSNSDKMRRKIYPQIERTSQAKTYVKRMDL